MDELEELNPNVSDATVDKHIQKLIDDGIVKEVPLEDDQRRQVGLTKDSLTKPHCGFHSQFLLKCNGSSI